MGAAEFGPGMVMLGRFQVVSKLGSGICGDAYQCFDIHSKIMYVVKVLPAEWCADAAVVNAISGNFQKIHDLNHPNIANTDMLLNDAGRYFLVREYIHGSTFVQGDIYALNDVCYIIGQIAEALSFAHSSCILHRNLKLSNIALSGGNTVKIMDFSLLAPGKISGGESIFYTAPEVIASGTVLPASDQYSLAVVAYSMLCGKLPFYSADMNALRNDVFYKEPEKIPSIDAAHWAVLRRALSKNPNDRFASCKEFAGALLNPPAAAVPVVTPASAGDPVPVVTPAPAGTPVAVAAPVAVPVVTPAPAGTPVTVAAPAVTPVPAEVPAKSGKKGLVIGIIILVIVLLALGGTGAFIFREQLGLDDLFSSSAQSSKSDSDDDSDDNKDDSGEKSADKKDKTAEKKNSSSEAEKKYRKDADSGKAVAQYNLAVCYANGTRGVEKNYETAVKWYTKAAEQNYAPAQTNLGVFYENGYGVKKDAATAAYWYKKAAANGHAIGQYNLALCYENGNGENKDPQMAYSWYLKAAHKNHAAAQLKVALCYENGSGVKRDLKEAEKWCRKAIDSGNNDANEVLKRIINSLEDEKYPTEAEKLYRRKAENGDAESQYQLGYCYLIGDRGLSKNYDQAFYWYSKAADQGHIVAYNDLGVCYENGFGVTKDYKQAVAMYRKSAEKGNLVACMNLGSCYERGVGVARDLNEAASWYGRAAEQGKENAKEALDRVKRLQEDEKYPTEAEKLYRRKAENGDAESQYQLGWCYLYGTKGLSKNYNQAFYWYSKAAPQGHAGAQCDLGYCYSNGYGVAKNAYTAFYWYKKSAENGNMYGQYNLGWCYETGNGVSKSIDQAVYWYGKSAAQGYEDAKEALDRVKRLQEDEKYPTEAEKLYRRKAENGDAESQYQLGKCYLNGTKGLSKNYNQAFYWFSKAALQGDAGAQCDLGYCYGTGSGVSKDFNQAFYWYKKSAENGNMYGQYNLGWCYENGNGVSKSIDQAAYWYGKSAAQGYENAKKALERVKRLQEEAKRQYYTEAEKLYRRKAENGDAESQYQLGWCYFNGQKDLSVNYNQAFYWYSKAAAQGHAGAQNDIGVCYANGWGVAKNMYTAFNWYKKSAENGNMYAEDNLGWCYMYGQGVSTNYNLAYYWCKRAADKGNPNAQNNVGLCYEKGWGVARNMYTAFNWYKKAAENGNMYAQRNVGLYYENGWGGAVRNINLAVYWYRKAAEQGHEDANAALRRLGY